jgi:hypothetical protein
MALRSISRVTTVLALFVLAGCAFQAPAYSWHRPGGSSPPSEQDRMVLRADEDACAEERNRSSLRMFYGALWYDVTQRTIYKDCMEARGWTKEEQR